MRDPQTIPTATFDHFDFFFSWVGCSVLFFLLTGSVFSFGFSFFSLVRSSVLVFYLFIFFILASVSLGTGKKKKKKEEEEEEAVPADRYGPTNSVKNIEWWKLGDDAKRVWKIEWWMMSDEWWVMKIEWSKKWSQIAPKLFFFLDNTKDLFINN